MKTIAILVAALLFAGCVSNAPMDITQGSRPSIIPSGFAVQVRPSLKLATAEDTLAYAGSTFSVQTGKVFRQVFTGSDAEPVTIDLLNSHIAQTNSDFMLLATVTQVTYTVTAVLDVKGAKHTLHATGVAQTKWDVTNAAKEAVERAVVDLAKQCTVYL